MRVQPEKCGLYEARNEHDACGIGAVANIDGTRNHTILELGNNLVLNLQHRGAAGGDGLTGDGAGILFQIPHEFLAEKGDECGVTLPEAGSYGVGMIFMPHEKKLQTSCRKIVEEGIVHRGLTLLGWREVP